MSSSTKSYFMVYAPDKTDEGALARRLSVRPKHLETAATNISSGYIRVGGVLISPESTNAAPENRKMVGSMFVCEAESLEEVKRRVESDIYFTAGVWDPERIVILPYLMATEPPPLPNSQL